MEFPGYISEYLLSHDKVFFPGLGTLKIIRKHAGVHRGKFNPPLTELELTPEVIPDEENSFPEYIAEMTNCSRDDAKQAILEYIDGIKFAFNKGEPFIMDGICSLVIDDDNNIEAIKAPEFIIDPDNYGLESFNIEGFEDSRLPGEPRTTDSFTGKESKKEKIELVLDIDHDMSKFEETYVTPVKREVAEQPAVEREEQVHKPEFVEPAGVHDPVRNKRRRAWPLVLVSGLALVVAIFFLIQKMGIWERGIGLDDFFGSSGEMEVNDDFSDMKDDEFDFDAMVGEMEGENDGTGSEANPKNGDEQVPGNEIIPAGEGHYIEYHIIAGSFHSYENARELQQQLTLVGYPSLVIDLGNGIYRVSAISYRNKVTALNELVKFREKTGMEGSWLMNLK